ncbi:MAG: aminotransferase class IV family protein [Pseudomonadota bacterium]|nr:aminotransferase class IV family protein [Pseudomonadota bacterium]
MESPFRASDDPDFRLIETFAFVPKQGVARLELHMARMARSAEVFGIDFDLSQARGGVAGLSAAVPLRCRLTLAPDGRFELTTTAMPVPADRWRFAIADTSLWSRDLFLRHKTTRRGVYDSARHALPAGIDELVFCNERGEICEGTITNIVVTLEKGLRVTPPLSSGCLPGVYRQSLIDAGYVREAVLTVADLRDAKSVHLVNALRGEIPAVLIEK